MKYVQVIPKFGGLSNQFAPHIAGPGSAQTAHGVDITDGTLQNVIADELRAYVGGLDAHDWNGYLIRTYSGNATPFLPHTYAEYGGRLVRSAYACIGAAWCPQYAAGPASNAPTWDVLGVKAPATACTAAVGAATGLTGTYNYYVTFINASGDESGPSPVASVTLANQKGSLSAIPISYGNGTTTNGSDSITAVANIASFRLGMRITSTAGIDPDTYVTAIDTGASTLTISKTATATGARILQDAQVTGRRIYRSGGSRSVPALLTEIADITTTTYTDSTADTSLGEAITTQDYDVFPAGGGIAISPAGVAMIVKLGSEAGLGTEVHFSEVGKPWGYTADNYITVSDPATHCSYGIDRFLVHTRGQLNVVVGTDKQDFELLLAQGEPAPVYTHQNFTSRAPAIQYQGAMWFTSLSGVMRYDGQSVECVTRDTFTRAQNKRLHIYGGELAVVGDSLYIMTAINADTVASERRVILKFKPGIGWSTSGSYDCEIVAGFYPGGMTYMPYDVSGSYQNQLVINDRSSEYYVADQPSSGTETRATGGVYWTGEWIGERLDGLKKIAGLVMTYVGSPQVDLYVDGTTPTGWATWQPAAATTPTRATFLAPQGIMGRMFSLKFTLPGSTDRIYSAGVMVGEERQVYP